MTKLPLNSVAKTTDLAKVPSSAFEPAFRDILALAVDAIRTGAVLALIDDAGKLRTSDAIGCTPPAVWPEATAAWLRRAGDTRVVDGDDPDAGFGDALDFTGAAEVAVLFDADGRPCGMLATFSDQARDHIAADESVRALARLGILGGQVERVLDLRREHAVLREVSLGLKESERSLTDEVTRLVGANNELDHYADFAAHELRSPLRTALLVLELIGREIDQPDGQIDRERVAYYLDQVRDGAEKMRAQLDGLLQLAQLTSEPPNSRWLELGALVDGVRRMHFAELAEAGAKLVLDPAAAGTRVFADPTHGHHLMSNLVANAIRYRDDDRPLTITVRAETDEATSTFTVADNGKGIAAEEHDHIFAMFGRVDHEAEGAGLGLALCRRLVRLYGGSLSVESTLGAGSAFSVRLPRRLEPIAPLADAAIASDGSITSNS